MVALKLFFSPSHPLAALRPDRRSHWYWYPSSLLQTKCSIGRDSFPHTGKGAEGASKFQKQADLKETQCSAVAFRYHCYSRVRLQPSSNMQEYAGLRFLALPTLLQEILRLLPLPMSLGRRLHRGHHSPTQTNAACITQQALQS